MKVLDPCRVESGGALMRSRIVLLALFLCTRVSSCGFEVSASFGQRSSRVDRKVA